MFLRVEGTFYALFSCALCSILYSQLQYMFLYLSLDYQSEGAKYGLYAVVPSQFYKNGQISFHANCNQHGFGAQPRHLSAGYLKDDGTELQGPRVLLIGLNILIRLLRLGWQKFAQKTTTQSVHMGIFLF